MARRKRAAVLQQQLEYATKRAAHVTPAKVAGGKPHPRPRAEYSYVSYGEKIGQTNATYTVQASSGAVAFFGGIGELGLTAYDTQNARVPRFFKPAKIHATIGTSDVTYVTAVASGRNYPKYTAKPTAEAPSSHTAPVSAADLTALLTKIKTVFTAKQGSVGGAHGRLWFTPEYSLVAENGKTA